MSAQWYRNGVPTPDRPVIEVGDWIVGPFSGQLIAVVNPAEWQSPNVLDRTTEIRKADGTIWRQRMNHGESACEASRR